MTTKGEDLGPGKVLRSSYIERKYLMITTHLLRIDGEWHTVKKATGFVVFYEADAGFDRIEGSVTRPVDRHGP